MDSEKKKSIKYPCPKKYDGSWYTDLYKCQYCRHRETCDIYATMLDEDFDQEEE